MSHTTAKSEAVKKEWDGLHLRSVANLTGNMLKDIMEQWM